MDFVQALFYNQPMVDTRFPVSVQIMLTLAYHQDELMNSEQLARVLKTNAAFIRKMVAPLVDAGLVASFRGKGGGIKLGKRPQDISLKEIYVVSLEEKPLVPSPNKPVTKACPVSCCMQEILCGIVAGIETTTKNYLAQTSLQDLLKQVS